MCVIYKYITSYKYTAQKKYMCVIYITSYKYTAQKNSGSFKWTEPPQGNTGNIVYQKMKCVLYASATYSVNDG